MLMSNRDRTARLHYMPNGFRLLSPGDHVLCAETGQKIDLEELRYWSVERQEAYATCLVAAAIAAPLLAQAAPGNAPAQPATSKADAPDFLKRPFGAMRPLASGIRLDGAPSQGALLRGTAP
eukprot:gene5172-6452_t